MILSLANALSVCWTKSTFDCMLKQSTDMGRTNERIGRIQETYVANATNSWLESLERSLAQLKDYQVGTFRILERF